MSTATMSTATKSNDPATVDFRQTGDKSTTKTTIDFVAGFGDCHQQCVPALSSADDVTVFSIVRRRSKAEASNISNIDAG